LTNGLVRLQTLVRNKHLTVEEAVAKWREWREASAFKRTLFSAEDAPVPAGWTATKHSLVDDELTISMDDPFGNSQAMLIAKINDGGRLRIENLFNSTGGGPFGQKPVTGLASRMMDEMYREAADRGLIVIHNNLTPQGTEFLKRYLWKRPNVAGQTKVELGYMGYGPQGVVSGEEWLKPHFKALRAKYGARDAQELVGIQTDRIVAQLSALGVPDNQILARIGEMSEAELVRLQQIARDQRLVLEMPSHHGIDSGPLGDKARPKIQLDEAVIRGRLSPEEAQQLRRERWAELKIDADYQEAQAIAHGQMADEQRDIIAALQTETFRRNSAWAKQQLDQTLGAEVKSGLITPSEAAHVLMRTEEMLEPNALLSQLRKVTGWVRSWQIATPGFVNRNIMGGMWNNGYYGESGVPMKAYREWMDLMHGVGPGETEPAILKLVAGKARKRLPELTPEQVVRRDEVLEAIGKGQVGSEYGHVQSWINQDRKANWLVPSSNHVIPYAIRSANERAEAVMRGALAYQVLEDGGKVEDATQWVIKLHFDYEDLSRAEKSLKNTFVPFYTYTRRNFPLQMEMLFAKPKTFARYKHFMDNMEAASPESELYIPGYYGREQFIPTPWSNEGGQMFLAPDLPFKDVNRMFDMATGDMGDNPVAPFQMVSPIFKAPLEYWAGKQSFKGLPLRGWEKPVALPDQLSFMGNALERAGRAKKRNGKWWVAEKDYWGLGQYLPPVGQVQRLWPADPKKQDKLTTSWLSWFGFGTRTLTVDDSEAAQYFEQEKKPLDVDREIDRELERYNKR
jgi:hypothetical protein